MASITRGAWIALTAVAALCFTAPSVTAATTTLRSGGADGPAYSGSVHWSLLGTGSVSNSTCTASTFDGTEGAITAASFTCNPAVNPAGLPWGLTFVYGPSGSSDGTVNLSNFGLSINVFSGVTCIYGGTVVMELYNPDNPSRPDPSVNALQARADSATIIKVSGSFLCPSSATLTATYSLTGDGNTLYITA